MLRRTLLALPLATPALAQDRPVRLVIAFPPGGSTDILGRLVAPRMSEVLGVLVTPENRSGASGAVGAGHVAQSAPDGTTLLLDSGGQTVNPFLMRGLAFDYVRDLAPVTLLAPGFTARALPVDLTNINNVRYAADGRLYAVGYDGRVHVLVDSDGDGLEDRVKPYWDRKGEILTPVGMEVRPEGVYVASRGQISLLKKAIGTKN